MEVVFWGRRRRAFLGIASRRGRLCVGVGREEEIQFEIFTHVMVFYLLGK